MILDVQGLQVSFQTRNGTVQAVRGIDLDLSKGERLGIVGESGSGKSVTSYAVLRLLDRAGRIDGGKIVYDGTDLRSATTREMQDLRGREISMVFQNPRDALNPIRKVGKQIEDVLRRHARTSAADARQKAIDALAAVRIENPEARYHAYPFELSGGMCQRVVIALALACEPRLLIADEPTTGLDVTTQRGVMDLIADLTNSRGLSLVLITHDLALAAEYCNRLLVMKDGEIVESGTPAELFAAPGDDYTRRLISATPRPGVHVGELSVPALPLKTRPPIGAPLLEVRHLTKHFGSGKRRVSAVNDVSFAVREGETLGLVGESGSGKSTTSSMIMRLLDPDGGDITLDGQTLLDTPAKWFARDPRRAQLQMVFQDATDSLNPRMTAGQAIAEPVKRLTSEDPKSRTLELARQVSLPEHLLTRLPHQLSGGQKARVGIARALAARPKLLVLDEPTAALDVSIQAVVLNLLADLRATTGISMLFVSHDLQVVRLLCDRVVVMRQGRVVESGPTNDVITTPSDAYTRELVAAAPASLEAAGPGSRASSGPASSPSRHPVQVPESVSQTR